jgi:hypothetical protein
MPPINQAVIASAGIVAVSVAVAAAIAMYESPEVRRLAEDLRRRIAIALHSLGDNVDPSQRQPMFNRPEDAEGFLQSRGFAGAEIGVDADEESRRRQREELMYWNALREEKQEKQEQEQEKTISSSVQGSTFDDFMKQDKTAERGTYVFNTGANVRPDDQGLVQRRGIVGVRGLNASVYANPFADENGIDFEDHPGMDVEPNPISPDREEIMSDIYNASPKISASQSILLQPVSQPAEILFDFNETQYMEQSVTPIPQSLHSSHTMERELADDEYVTAGQDDRHDAYASIQAWAQSSNTGFYSPLPMSPPAPLSEPEIISTGVLTPTDSVSVIGSGEDLGNYASSTKAGTGASDYGVMSEDEDGMATPNSWSEVGSVVSESDSPIRR